MNVALKRKNAQCFEVVLDRPAKRNALTLVMLDAVVEAVQEAAMAGARVVVLRSSSPAGFSAGADLREWEAFSAAEAVVAARRGLDAMERVACGPIPLIAEIRGYCLGGGLELALACDIRMADDTASFGFPEVTFGGAPSWGGIPRLVRAIGEIHARRLMLTGVPVTGVQAFEMGLVNAVVSATDLARHVACVAEAIAACPPEAVATIRRSIDAERQ